jgi:dTDP-4-amino-4,6-dideoxygalactose transaminase
MHHLPPYYQQDGDLTLPITTNLAARGINLPSSALLTRDDITYIASALQACLHGQVPAVSCLSGERIKS